MVYHQPDWMILTKNQGYWLLHVGSISLSLGFTKSAQDQACAQFYTHGYFLVYMLCRVCNYSLFQFESWTVSWTLRPRAWLTQAAVWPFSQSVVSLPAVVATLSLHAGFTPTLTRDQPGSHISPRVTQSALQRPGRITVTSCENMKDDKKEIYVNTCM